MAWGTGARDRTSTAAHQARRKRVLKRDGYECRLRGPRCIGTATECDHIINNDDHGLHNDLNIESPLRTQDLGERGP